MTSDQQPAPVVVECERCGRKLKDAASRERGLGPVCERKWWEEGKA